MIRIRLHALAALTFATPLVAFAPPAALATSRALPAPPPAAAGPQSRSEKAAALDAWLFAAPPAAAPGFTFMGTAFVYQDDINDRGEDFDADGDTWPGWGESDADPVGAPFELPEGLVLNGPFHHYNASDPKDCDDKYENEAAGAGSLVQICLVVRNTTARPLLLELPPGLIFTSRSRQVQNGVLMHKVALEIPAGAVFFQPLFLHCTNSGFDPSSHEEQGYDIGSVQTHPAVQDVIALIADKQVDRWYFPIVSQAVTDLGDGGKLRAHTRRGLNALPPR